jgi:hypothetical protein
VAEPVTQVARRRYSADAARLFDWYERLYEQQSPFRENWQVLADYLDPNRSSITFQAQPGAKRTEKLFDSTAPHAADVCASNIHGALTNPSQKFYSLAARQKEINDSQGVRAWCEETSDRNYMAINNSNHVAQAAEFYKDMVVFCTGAMLLEEGTRLRPGQYGGHRYKALPVGGFVVDENADERVDVLMRGPQELTMSVRAACERWANKPNSSVPDKWLTMVNSRPEEPVEIIHAIYPRRDRNRRAMDASNMPFASCWFTVAEKHRLGEGGYHEFPGAVARWSKRSREKYGRGPSWIALPDIKTLNRAIELYLSAGAKAVEPTLLELFDSVIGPTTLEPAAINTIRQPDALVPLESKSRWDIAVEINERLERKINAIFMIDQFDTPKTGAPLTATEAAIINERTLRLLGPGAGRLMYEWFIPMREREIALMFRAGALPDPPDELAQSDADLDIVAEGPLARAQRAQDMVAIERSYTLGGHIANLTGDQAIFDNWDSDEAAKEIAMVSGMPANISREKKLIDGMREARAQKAAADAKMMAIAQGAESLGKAAPGLKVLQGGQGAEAPAPAAA